MEIGSGTGQHLFYFSSFFPEITWQASDVPENLAVIQSWLSTAPLDNVLEPIALDVCQNWPPLQYEYIYSANTVHIMSMPEVECLIRGIGEHLRAEGLFLLYGPFHYYGKPTSESNARFDDWLKQQDPASGVRDFDWLDRLAQQAGLKLYKDVAMPANNRMLIWQKLPV